MKRVILMIAVSMMLFGCFLGGEKQERQVNTNQKGSFVTVNWEYDKSVSPEIVGLRLYQAGGSLLCATENPEALEMNCLIDREMVPKRFKLAAYDADWNERIYPAVFAVN